MPIHDFICDKCEYETSEIISIKDEVKFDCPKCGEPMRKKISSKVTFKLKGSGFHCNDYGKTGPKRK